jgi:hypothetical protein
VSLNLSINNKSVITAKDKSGADVDAFRSFWLGYTFATPVDANKLVAIGKGCLAVYCSHDSAKDIPARGAVGPELAKYGPLEGKLEIYYGSDKKKGNALTLDHLDYIGAEDIECANQAMQLHLSKFEPARGRGIVGWVDDTKWAASELPKESQTSHNKPYWKRTVGYNKGTRYAHFIHRHRNARGLQTVAAALPFGSQSLFSFWLKQHGLVIPELEFSAKGVHTGKNPDAGHWSEKAGPANIVEGTRPRGLAMVTMGAFGALRPTDLMRDAWLALMDGNSDFELARTLAAVVSDGSPRPHTLRQLATHSVDCVVTAQNDSPQEFFYPSLLAPQTQAHA